MINLHDRRFTSTSAFGRQEILNFHFKQYREIVHGYFNGEKVHYGQLIGLVNNQGILHFTFSCAVHASGFISGTGTLSAEKPGMVGSWCWTVGTQVFEEPFSWQQFLPRRHLNYTIF